jgi:GNAT superfamily N-acetyltransferase
MSPVNTITIRHRTTADLQACVGLLRRIHEGDRYPVHWPADPIAFLTPEDALVTWVATRDGALVGHVMLADAPAGLSEATSIGRQGLVLLRQLFVAPEARGQRLGRQLLDVAAAEAAARGRRAALEVLSVNADAIAMYERAGWTAVGTSTPHWVPDGMHAVVFLAPS